MIEIEKPRIEALDLESDGTYGKFVVEPLERGYGMTLGNSLRRVLLSSLPGVAVTSIKIDGIQHEFSTVPGQVTVPAAVYTQNTETGEWTSVAGESTLVITGVFCTGD